MTSVFAKKKYLDSAYPHRFAGSLLVHKIMGGTPTDTNVAIDHIKRKLAGNDDLIREAIAELMEERGITAEEAVPILSDQRHLSGFKRDEHGLYIEGRQLKACLKEAANIAANSGKLPAGGWGNPTNKNYLKGIKAWFPEHVFVVEDHLALGASEPSGILQSFIMGRYGTSISYEEYVEDAKIDFTVITDHPFTDQEWAAVWLTAEQNGLGASRSQGFGRFEVTKWEKS